MKGGKKCPMSPELCYLVDKEVSEGSGLQEKLQIMDEQKSNAVKVFLQVCKPSLRRMM